MFGLDYVTAAPSPGLAAPSTALASMTTMVSVNPAPKPGSVPGLPYDKNTVSNCRWWWDDDGSMDCYDIPLNWGISVIDWFAWNPVVQPNCRQFPTGRSYCVEADSVVVHQDPWAEYLASKSASRLSASIRPSASTSSSSYATASTSSHATASTSSHATASISSYATASISSHATASSSSVTSHTRPSNGIITPQPTQPDMTPDCDRFYLVRGDEKCVDIARSRGISLAEFTKWNPRAGDTCSGLKSEAYACVGVPATYDFSGDLSEWKFYDGSFNIRSQALEASNSVGGKALLNTMFTDFILEADLRLPDGANGNAGLLFRVSKPAVGQDNYRGYYAGISSDGSVVLGRANNDWTHLGAHSLDFRPKRVYNMKVHAKATSIEIYVDDMEHPKISVTDGTYRRGQVGVRVWKTAVIYDNIRVASMSK